MIDVLILDASPERRDHLKKLVLVDESFRVIGQSGTIQEGAQLAQQFNPHVILVGNQLEDGDGPTAIRRLREMGVRRSTFVMLTDSKTIADEAQQAGAHKVIWLLDRVDWLSSDHYGLIFQLLSYNEHRTDEPDFGIAQPAIEGPLDMGGAEQSQADEDRRHHTHAKPPEPVSQPEESGEEISVELPKTTAKPIQPILPVEEFDNEKTDDAPTNSSRPPAPITQPTPAPDVKPGVGGPATGALSTSEAPASQIPRMVDKKEAVEGDEFEEVDGLFPDAEIDDEEEDNLVPEPEISAGEKMPEWLREPAKTGEAAPVLDKTARFSAYYPPQTPPEQRAAMHVYAHTLEASADIQKDMQKFAEEMGGTIRPPRVSTRTAAIAAGTPLTIVPECEAFEFEPASLTKKWRGDWTRFDFDFTPPKHMTGDIVLVRISIQVAGIEIAHITCPIEIHDPDFHTVIPLPQGDSVPVNPLAAARLRTSSSGVYSKIFISYSRKDMEVVKAYRLAQLAAGHEVFMDTESIHTGENWQAALAKAIDEADIFQLFWSPHSAASVNVRDEWDYCLRYKCQNNSCAGFIRPVFWQKPMPAPPKELSHLNFRFVPLVADEEDDA